MTPRPLDPTAHPSRGDTKTTSDSSIDLPVNGTRTRRHGHLSPAQPESGGRELCLDDPRHPAATATIANPTRNRIRARITSLTRNRTATNPRLLAGEEIVSARSSSSHRGYRACIERTPDIYKRLRPSSPTPADEMCSCTGEPPIKLMTMRQVGGFNPIHCLDCNLEVPPERVGLELDVVEAIASWDAEHGAIETLELLSGDYEMWARARLLDPQSPTNVEGRELARRLNDRRRCYMWFFQPQSDDDWRPRDSCPSCGAPLEPYEHGIFPQLLCERDRLVLVGGR